MQDIESLVDLVILCVGKRNPLKAVLPGQYNVVTRACWNRQTDRIPPVRDPNVAVAHLCGLRLASNVRSVADFAVRWHIGHAVPYEAARPCMAAETHEDPTVTARLTSSRGACNMDKDKSPALLQTRKAAIVRQCRATRLCQTFTVRSKASHTHRHHPVQCSTLENL